MDGGELKQLYECSREAAVALYAQAADITTLAELLEALTKGTPAWYAGTRARARVALEQAEELRRVLEELGERLGR